MGREMGEVIREKVFEATGTGRERGRPVDGGVLRRRADLDERVCACVRACGAILSAEGVRGLQARASRRCSLHNRSMIPM